MEYLKLFENHSQYEDFLETEDFVRPNVSHCIQENEVHYNKVSSQKLFARTRLVNGVETILCMTEEDKLLVATMLDNDYGFYYDQDGWHGVSGNSLTPLITAVGGKTEIISTDFYGRGVFGFEYGGVEYQYSFSDLEFIPDIV